LGQQSLNQKFDFLSRILHPWNHLIDPVISVAEDQRIGYRSKVSLAVNLNKNEWQFGMLKKEEIIPIHHCPVHSFPINQLIGFLADILPANADFPLKRLVVSGKQVVLVVKSGQIPDSSWLTDHITFEIKKIGFDGVWFHLNPSTGKRVFGKGGWHLMWGEPISVDEEGLVYGPASFQQLIPGLARVALDTATDFLKPDKNAALVDLYCGTGSGLRRWLFYTQNVLGVELSMEAVRCTLINAPGALVYVGKCSQRIPQINAFLGQVAKVNTSRLLYVNPPRTGVEPEITEWIISKMQPHRLAYLSCSAGTLKRDLYRLESGGYTVVRIQPFDFFPLTKHVESLAMLERS